MNTDREKAKLLAVLDTFFGTINGYPTVKTMYRGVDGVDVISTLADLNSTNVLDELDRLGVMLCGGAINSIFSGNPVNDLDFYVRESKDIPEVKMLLLKWFPEVAHRSLNATTYKRKAEGSRKKYTVQIIERFTGPPDTIFDWFDFTITHGCYCFASREFRFGFRFFPDLAAKRLVYSGNSKYPICAMYRTKKYQDRGYSLSGATIMHIALSIVQLDIRTYHDLKQQLMGIDTMYLQNLLDSKEPENPVDYGEFIEEAFQRLDGRGNTTAETEEEIQ
jgi:hypothetical protein